MDTKGGKRWGGGGGGVMNWAIGIDLYTLMCIKLMTNKNLLYKKINKIKFKKKHTIDSQKPVRKELKCNTKENYQTTKGKTKRRKEQRRNTRSTGKQGLKWQ